MIIYNTNNGNDGEMKDVKYLSAGIHENVKLVGSRFDKSQNGNLFIEFKFEKDGQIFTHTEYEVNKYGDESDAEVQSKADKQVKRIMQILGAFYSKDKLSYMADSYSSFGKWVDTLMNNADKNILVRLKIVYNTNGYTTLPRYSVYTFIEPMSIDKNSSKIRELQIDSFTRQTADIEQESTSAENVFYKQTQESSEVPF